VTRDELEEEGEEILVDLALLSMDRLVWFFLRPIAVVLLAQEIRDSAQDWIERDAELRYGWEWETDVLIRIEIDKKARVRSC